MHFAVTLKFVDGGDDAKALYVERDLGVSLRPWRPPLPPRLPLDPEQQAAGTEAVGTHGVAVGVLGPEVQLQPLSGVCIDLRRGQRRQSEAEGSKAAGSSSLRESPTATQVAREGPGGVFCFVLSF